MPEKKFTKTILVPCESFVMTDENRTYWQGVRGPARGVLVSHARHVAIGDGVRTITNANRKTRRAFAATGKVAA